MQKGMAWSTVVLATAIGACAGQPPSDVVPPEEAKGQKIIFRGTAVRADVAPPTSSATAGERP